MQVDSNHMYVSNWRKFFPSRNVGSSSGFRRESLFIFLVVWGIYRALPQHSISNESILFFSALCNSISVSPFWITQGGIRLVQQHVFCAFMAWWGTHNARPAVTLGELLGMPRARDLASLLPRVVFQLVVVVQTVIAVVRSWPIAADLTALRVAGTFPEEIRTTFRKNGFK